VSHWHTAMHLPALRAAGGNIVAVADADITIARRIANECSAQAFTGLESLLGSVKPDLVLVMGKPSEVVAGAKVVIDAGIPSIVEKPIGLTIKDVEPLALKAERRGVFVTVPLVNRYSQLWRKLDELRARDALGERLHAHFRVVNGLPFRYRRMGVE